MLEPAPRVLQRTLTLENPDEFAEGCVRRWVAEVTDHVRGSGAYTGVDHVHDFSFSPTQSDQSGRHDQEILPRWCRRVPSVSRKNFLVPRRHFVDRGDI